MQLELNLTGWADLERQFQWILKYAPKSAMAGLLALGEKIMAIATQMVPVDTGQLRRSGYVAPEDIIHEGVVEVGFGTDYAVYVHENVSAAHVTGEARFLQKAVYAVQNTALETIVNVADRVRRLGQYPKVYRTKYPMKPLRGGGA